MQDNKQQTLFKRVDYSLENLMSYIKIGDIGLPDIQRPFVWRNAKVRDLFDSMYRGYPVGYLVFWQSGNNTGSVRTVGADQKQKTPQLLIVDGQQRLTALYAVTQGVPVVRENYEKEFIQIAFRPKDEKFEVADAATLRDPEFIPNISNVWEHNDDPYEIIEEFLERLKKTRDVDPDEARLLRKAISRLSNIMNFPFTVLELAATTDEEQVAEVFVRINSTGETLNQSNYILTLMSVFWDAGRAELEEFCRKSRQPSKGISSPYNEFIDPHPGQLLRVSVGLGFKRARLSYVYSILRGKDLDTEQFSSELREIGFARLKEAQSRALSLTYWHDFFKVLMQAGFRSGKMISSYNNLLFAYIFYLIGRTELKVEPYELKNVVARWFFMTSLTRRFTTSPESSLEADLARLRNVDNAPGFLTLIDQLCRDNFTDDYWQITLPNELATSSPNSPSLFAYLSALNILNAKVLFSNNHVSELMDPIQTDRAPIERHHLFPRAFLEKQGYSDLRSINQIANYALVEWGDNGRISDESPRDYYPNYELRINPNDLARMRYWHALPENWHLMNYDEFLQERRKMMAQVIRDAYSVLESYSLAPK